MTRFLILVAVIAGLLESCSGQRDSECEPVSPRYTRAIQLGLVTRADKPTDFVTARSAIPGTWYVAASVDGASPVWVTDRDPRGDVVGEVLAANQAAQRTSRIDFNMPVSRSELAQAAGDPDGIRAAEACVAA
jgi:hypothetical protein